MMAYSRCRRERPVPLAGTAERCTRELDRWVLVVEAKVSLHDEVLTEVRANHGATGAGPISSLLGSGAVVVFGPA